MNIKKITVCNAFSLSMLPGTGAVIRFYCVSPPDIFLRTWQDVARTESYSLEIVSAVGHPSTAAIFEAELGIPVPVNRVNVCLPECYSENLLIGQYKGPRLPEGATKLPPGASIEWWVAAHDHGSICAPEDYDYGNYHMRPGGL